MASVQIKVKLGCYFEVKQHYLAACSLFGMLSYLSETVSGLCDELLNRGRHFNLYYPTLQLCPCSSSATFTISPLPQLDYKFQMTVAESYTRLKDSVTPLLFTTCYVIARVHLSTLNSFIKSGLYRVSTL